MKQIIWIFLIIFMISFANADVYINQIMYDYDGADDGYEWIELSTTNATLLENYSLYYNSGDSWELIWDGQDCGCSILDYYVIGQEFTNADSYSDFSLGNTKGALKLVENESDVDLVGYGDSTIYSINPASDVNSNMTLLRVNYTNDNLIDFKESDAIFNSVKIEDEISITIKQRIPSISISQLSSVEVFAGDSAEIELSFNSNGEYDLDIAGTLSSSGSKIAISPFKYKVNEGENLVIIGFDVPKSAKAGNYVGNIQVVVN